MRIGEAAQQEPFRAPRAHWLGLALYALAILAGGPAIVAARRMAPGLEPSLRATLAMLAFVAIVLLAAGGPRAPRLLFALGAGAALVRSLAAFAVVDPGPLALALLEGAEMALVALGLRAVALRVAPQARRAAFALLALAVGAFALKLAWAFGAIWLVRVGGLALLPLALVALGSYVRLLRTA